MPLCRKDNGGQELVEYAIVFFVLFLLILGIIEFGIIIFSQNSVTNVAREGARWSVVRRSSPDPSTYIPAIGGSVNETCPGTHAVVVAACTKALALDPGQLAVTVSRPNAAEISVEIRYDYNPFFGLIEPFLPSGLTLGSRSTMRLE
ncbi:MAG: TadE family protein [Chloroflexota bacterium]|nr:TadE family protein [Chloroflexota bacterium]